MSNGTTSDPVLEVTYTVPAPTVTSTYTYDASGHPVKVVSGGVTTIYPTKLYNTDGTTPMKHIFAGNQTIATIKGTGASAIPYYVATDHLTGSNIVTTSTGTQEELMDYYPFGAIRLDEKSGTFSEQRKFTGYEYDTDTGLNYAQARYQNPSLGRFISQDPVFWDFDESYLTDPQQWNSYSYARNNPLVYIDPQGEEAELVVKPITLTNANITIPGAHGFISINAESGVDLSKYGEGPHYTIGGYPSDGIGGSLQTRINDSWDFSFDSSKALATYPLSPPTGMSVAEYDQKLLETGTNLSNQDLGQYSWRGQPISKYANSGNTATQVIIDAGGEVPKTQGIYIGPTPLPRPLHYSPFPYFAPGLENPLGTPSYSQRIENAARKAEISLITTVATAVLNYVIKTKF